MGPNKRSHCILSIKEITSFIILGMHLSFSSCEALYKKFDNVYFRESTFIYSTDIVKILH